MKLTDNAALRENILKRLKELDWKDSFLINDAKERGMIIEAARWSKYKKNKSGQITDETLLWIATRLGINISVRIGDPVVKDGKVTCEIGRYNELNILRRLKVVFPKK